MVLFGDSLVGVDYACVCLRLIVSLGWLGLVLTVDLVKFVGAILIYVIVCFACFGLVLMAADCLDVVVCLLGEFRFSSSLFELVLVDLLRFWVVLFEHFCVMFYFVSFSLEFWVFGFVAYGLFCCCWL